MCDVAYIEVSLALGLPGGRRNTLGSRRRSAGLPLSWSRRRGGAGYRCCHKQVRHDQVHLQLHTKARHALLRTGSGLVEAEVGRALSTGAGE